MHVHSHSPLSRGSQVSRTFKSQEGGAVQGGRAKPLQTRLKRTKHTQHDPPKPKPWAVHCPRGHLRFHRPGSRLTTVSSPALETNLQAAQLCTVGSYYPTLHYRAASEKGPQAARLWRVAATERSAGQLLKELHGSAAHKCQLAPMRKLRCGAGGQRGLTPRRKLPQAQQKRLTQNR